MQVQNEMISLGALTLRGEVQQRAIDPETVNLYAERIKAGDRFPPIEVVEAPEGLVPWDGWHRIKAAQKAGVGQLAANIRPGSLLDAIRLSYRANGRNGRPLTPREKAAIVAKVYADKELYNRVTHKEIGGWVGLTESAVSKIISKLRKSENRNFHDTGHARVRTTAPRKTDVEPDRMTDQEGIPLPEHLIPVFERRREIRAWRGHVERLWQAVKAAADSGDPFLRYLRVQTFKAECSNLRRAIDFALPYAVCPYCSGDGGVEGDCRACDGSGWVNSTTWLSSPQEYKEAMKKLRDEDQ